MTIFEILNLHRGLLSMLHASGVRMDDIRYIDLYVDYSRMLADGDKVSYIIAKLSDRHLVSERTIYSLVKRFRATAYPVQYR